MDEPQKNDPLDPNEKKVLDSMREHGELLRKADEGRTATETALNLDLHGRATDAAAAEHEDVFQQLGQRVEQDQAAQPQPQPLPSSPPTASDPKVHADTFRQLSERSAADVQSRQPAPEAPRSPPAATKPRRTTRKARATPRAPASLQERQSGHNAAFVQLGERARVDSRIRDEQPTPILTTFSELEHATFPGGEQTEHLAGTAHSFLKEDANWRVELTHLLKVMADVLRQHSYELREIRAAIERSR